MVKRKRDKSLSSAKSTLRLHIISSNLAASCHTTVEVVAHLCFLFREYSRLPKNSFVNNVERILSSLRQHGGDESGGSNSATNSGANNFSMSTSGSADDDDAGINAKIEPEFDLRDNYVKKNKSVRTLALEVKRNMEIQTEGKDGRKLENDVSRHKEDAVTSNEVPSFDLGRMIEVLEKLEKKTLFPFF